MSVNEINPSKDYYLSLDVSVTANPDEIKAAYLQLALKHHPDVAGNSKDNVDKFKEIQEAFTILSKPELRAFYDRSRISHGYVENTLDASSIAEQTEGMYTTQKANYSVLAKHVGNHWKQNIDKYRTEKWSRLPLSEKKAHRKLPVSNFSGIVYSFVGCLAVFGVIGYVASYSSRRKSTHGSSNQLRGNS